MRFILAQTGASGQIYGLRLLQRMLAAQAQVSLCFSEAACVTMAVECGIKINAHSADLTKLIGDANNENIRYFAPREIAAPIASGSNPHDGMIIAPCSMGTLARIAAGTADDLISRAADVALKERRKLILLVRETPFSQIHLRNMLTVSQAGALVMPACPHFYHSPQTVDELVDTVVERILDHLNIGENSARWRENELPG
jgi:4-hydroxy-3-polyprenylbenzoate decarboxylase